MLTLRHLTRVLALQQVLRLPQMPTLYIRDVSETLYRKLKSEAILRGLTLREYVILQLGEETHAEASRIPDVQPEPAIRADARRESVPSVPTTPSWSVAKRLQTQIPGLKPASELPSKRTCAHGMSKGYHCWQCRGIAKVESAS